MDGATVALPDENTVTLLGGGNTEAGVLLDQKEEGRDEWGAQWP